MAAPLEGDPYVEPLHCKKWVLKVSIHCEGCKRKVKRILHSVDGVYTIDIEAKQHKVVVTGNVDAYTLLKKLEKSGKHAELWPNTNNFHPNEQPPQQQQPPPPSQNEDGNQTQNSGGEQQQQQQQQPPENSNQPPHQPQQHHHQQQQNQVVKEVRFDGNTPAGGENQPPPGNTAAGGGGGGGGAKKKKKKKKSNGNTNGDANNNGNVDGAVNSCEVREQPPTESQPPPPHPSPQQNEPGHGMGPMYNAPVYHAPPQPQPVYGMSYNTAYPRSHTASYYSAPLPYSYSYAYAHAHHGGDVEQSLPSDWSGPASLQPADTFELFSDENPNACSVM